MIAAGMGPQPGEIKTVNDALDALNDARMWLKTISQYETVLADTEGITPDCFKDPAMHDAMYFLTCGIEAEIGEAQAVLAAARGRDIETEVEALSVIGEVLGRE